jgi:hypothetical protein
MAPPEFFRRELTGSLRYPPDASGSITASPDAHTLYYGAQQEEANIRMARRAGAMRTGPCRAFRR